MTTDCSLNYEFSTWKLQAQNMGRTCCVHKLFFVFVLTFRKLYTTCSTHVLSLQLSCTEITNNANKWCENFSFFFQVTICISGQYLLFDRSDYECSGTLYRSQLDCIRRSGLLANNWSGRGGCVWILPKLACSQRYRLQVRKLINLGISTQASFWVCKAAIQV